MIRHLKTYRELEHLSKDFNLGFHLEYIFKGNEDKPDGFFKLSNHHHPFSLREEESQIIYDSIVSNNLQAGIEIATAFGISSSVIGQALKITGGKLVTIDAYIEEAVNSARGYTMQTRTVNSDADGYKMANALYKLLEIQDIVTPVVGWSPDDVPYAIETSGISSPLDFAFIDGGHSFDQINADVSVILPYLSENCLLIFHDWNEARKQDLETRIKLSDLGFLDFKQYKTSFNLAMYKRGNIELP